MLSCQKLEGAYMLSFFTTLHTLTLTAVGRARRDERGASAVEYALVVGGIAVLVVAAIALFGPQLNTLWGNIIPTTP